MRIKIALFFIFCSMLVFGVQPNLQSTNEKKPNLAKVNLVQSDTLIIKQASDSKESILIDKRMPWIVALTIGIFSALINFLIANGLRLSNEKNLQKQIDNAKETAHNEFRATIATKNRQDWINEIRHCLSEYLTYIGFITPHGELFDIKERSLYLEKTVIAKSKMEILINYNKAEQKEFLDAVNNLYNICCKDANDYKDEDFKDARNNVIDNSRKLFAIHWTKIKELK